MNIVDFNKSQNRFRFVEGDVYAKTDGTKTRRFHLEEFCPKLGEQWHRSLLPFKKSFSVIGQMNDTLDQIEVPTSFCRILLEQNINYVLCVFNKHFHAPQIYDANTTEKIALSALKILQDKVNNNCFRDWGGVVPAKPPTHDKLDLSNDPKLSEYLTRRQEDYRAAFLDYQQMKKDAQQAQQALQTKNHVLAFELIMSLGELVVCFETMHNILEE